MGTTTAPAHRGITRITECYRVFIYGKGIAHRKCCVREAAVIGALLVTQPLLPGSCGVIIAFGGHCLQSRVVWVPLV